MRSARRTRGRASRGACACSWWPARRRGAHHRFVPTANVDRAVLGDPDRLVVLVVDRHELAAKLADRVAVGEVLVVVKGNEIDAQASRTGKGHEPRQPSVSRYGRRGGPQAKPGPLELRPESGGLRRRQVRLVRRVGLVEPQQISGAPGRSSGRQRGDCCRRHRSPAPNHRHPRRRIAVTLRRHRPVMSPGGADVREHAGSDAR